MNLGDRLPGTTTKSVRCIAENVEIPVIGPHFEVGTFRAIPLVLDLQHLVASFPQKEPHRALVRFEAGITLHSDLHLLILQHLEFQERIS